jgi:hypothetical protein
MNRSLLSRSLGLLIATVVGIISLLVLPGPTHPPGADPASILKWWDTAGTPAATLAVLRLAMLAGLTYAALVAFWAAVLALITTAGRVTIPRFAPPGLRRYLAGGALALAVMGSPVAVAQHQESFSVVDLGPVGDPWAADNGPPEPFIAVDLGPIDSAGDKPGSRQATEDEAPLHSAAPVADDVWVVQRGDHLWSIAAETVADQLGATTDNEIERYWRLLIEDNHEVIGSDPDLIIPGQTLVLPPL